VFICGPLSSVKGAWMRIFNRFLNDECGATAIEYGLIAALVFLGASTAILAYGDSFKTMYILIAEKLAAAIGA